MTVVLFSLSSTQVPADGGGDRGSPDPKGLVFDNTDNGIDNGMLELASSIGVTPSSMLRDDDDDDSSQSPSTALSLYHGGDGGQDESDGEAADLAASLMEVMETQTLKMKVRAERVRALRRGSASGCLQQGCLHALTVSWSCRPVERVERV